MTIQFTEQFSLLKIERLTESKPGRTAGSPPAPWSLQRPYYAREAERGARVPDMRTSEGRSDAHRHNDV